MGVCSASSASSALLALWLLLFVQAFRRSGNRAQSGHFGRLLPAAVCYSISIVIVCIFPHSTHWKGNERRFFAVGAAVCLSGSFGGCMSSILQFRATAQRAYKPDEIPREICEDNALCVIPNLLANSVIVKPLAPKYFFRAVLSLFICSCVFIDYQVFAAKIVNIFENRKY